MPPHLDREQCKIYLPDIVHATYNFKGEVYPQAPLRHCALTCAPVQGNGDCGFATLAYIIGANPSDVNCLNIRSSICRYIQTIPWGAGELEAFVPAHNIEGYAVTVCENADQYLRLSNMFAPGRHATDVEFVAFATEHNLEIFCYHAQLQAWIVYKPHRSVVTDPTSRRAVYVRHSHAHWEPVLSLEPLNQARTNCIPAAPSSMDQVPLFNTLNDQAGNHEHTNTNMGTTTRRCSTQDYNIPRISRTCSRKRRHVDPPEKQSDDEDQLIESLDQEDIIFHKSAHYTGAHRVVTEQGDFCDKCLRRSTPYFPLEFIMKSTETVMHGWFGAAFGNKENLNLCHLCDLYITKQKDRRVYNKWQYAWPSVISTLLIDTRVPSEKIALLYSWLPHELRQSWSHMQLYFHPRLQERPPEPTFSDITERRQSFLDDISSLESHRMSNALNAECYPSARCPFGCYAFVEEDGAIEFKHLINCLIPTFTSFKSSYQSSLRGMRRDFLKPMLHLDTFLVSGRTRVDQNLGLVIHTCKEHNRGSALQYVHPPKHPTLSRLPSMKAERLAFLVPSLRQLKTGKANYSSHTYQLLHAQGGYGGISSTVLTKRRRWDITSDILSEAEAQCVAGRSDIRSHIQGLASAGEINASLAEEFIETANKACSQDHVVLKSSTSISIEACLNFDKNVSATRQEATLCISRLRSLVFAQPSNAYGVAPAETRKLHDEKLWLLRAAISISPRLCSIVGDMLSADINLLPLAQYLSICLFEQSKNFHRSNGSDSASAALESAVQDSSERNAAEAIADFLSQHSDVQRLSTNGVHSLDELRFENDLVVITNRINRATRHTKLEDRVIFDGNVYELRFVSNTMAKQITHWKAITRHGGQHSTFWLQDNQFKSPQKQNPEVDICTERHFGRGQWNLAIYYKANPETSKVRRALYLEHITGQGKFVCSEHGIPLTKDYPGNGYTCQCGRVSALRCAESKCTSAICRKHMQEKLHEDSYESCTLMPVSSKQQNILAAQPSGDKHAFEADIDCDTPIFGDVANFANDEDLNEANINLDNEFMNYVTDAGPCLSDDEEVDGTIIPSTDTGVREQFFVDTTNDSDLPLHVLLNGHHGLLRRTTGKPISMISRHKRTLENLVATSTDGCAPTIYPEAMLYPTVFWKQNDDASYPGAIPSILYNPACSNRSVNFASIQDMMKTRLKDSSLQTSSSPFYQAFAFDTIFNQQLNTADSRIILHRGWQELASKNARSVSKDGTMRMESDESYRNVRELSAALANEPATYFYTYTCNQSEHPGVKPIFEALRAKFSEHSHSSETINAAIQAELSTMLRAWERSSRLMMKYIEKSPEQPLGPVKKLWYRYEFQDKTGAFPHIHALIWTGEDQHSEAVKQRIVCSSAAFLGETNKFLKKTGRPEMTNEEFVKNWSLFESIQSHSCENAKFRCHKKTDQLGRSVCRVPNYEPSNSYSYEPIHFEFSEETKNLFLELGLAYIDPVTCRLHISPELIGGKHSYPANRHETISPTNASLFYILKSSLNLQICDKYMSGRYVAKYAAGIEARASMKIISSGQEDTFEVRTGNIQNVKISGVKATEERKAKDERVRTKFEGRVLSQTEALWFAFEFPYVATNMEFVHLPTVSKEFRTGLIIEKKGRRQQHQSGGGNYISEAHRVRQQMQLPSYRQFMSTQRMLIEDVETSNVTPDKITVFGVRPPELRFVDSPIQYFKWFRRERPTNGVSGVSVHERLLKTDATMSPWIDGLGHIVKLRPPAVTSFMNYAAGKIGVDGERHDVARNFSEFSSAIGCGNQWNLFVNMDSSVSKVEAQVR